MHGSAGATTARVLFRGVNGANAQTGYTRPVSPDYLEVRLGAERSFLFTGGLPFVQRHGNRMADVILVPEGEQCRAFDLLLATDRDVPMQTALGWVSPAPVVETEKGPPHFGSTGLAGARRYAEPDPDGLRPRRAGEGAQPRDRRALRSRRPGSAARRRSASPAIHFALCRLMEKGPRCNRSRSMAMPLRSITRPRRPSRSLRMGMTDTTLTRHPREWPASSCSSSLAFRRHRHRPGRLADAEEHEAAAGDSPHDERGHPDSTTGFGLGGRAVRGVLRRCRGDCWLRFLWRRRRFRFRGFGHTGVGVGVGLGGRRG